MKNKDKIIRDSIHGNINIDGIFLDLVKTPEIQRLHNVKQLGLTNLVYPGANHTRFEHSIGTYYLACKVSKILNFDKYEHEILACAALLHDIGHGPFSHTLESLIRNSLNVNHVDLTNKIIYGDYEILYSKEKEFILYPSVNEILINNNINLDLVTNIIKGADIKKPYLYQILDSAIDVDQLDYLIRDSYYTGVAYGLIDIQRFLQTIIINNGQLAILRKGVGVIENILMARILMYSSVYFHKTVRIAELMLSKSIEMINDMNPINFFKMTDEELINNLKNQGRFQNEIITYLKYRILFKQAYIIDNDNLDENKTEIIKLLENPEKRKDKEREIEEILNIDSGHVIIDVPHIDLQHLEPRINQTNITIFDKNENKTLDEFTPVAKAIKSKSIPDWHLMILTDQKHRELVEKKAENILFK